MRLNDGHKKLLRELYREAGYRTVDELPYTDTFERLYSRFAEQTGLAMNRHELWRALSNERKAGLLVRKKK